MPFQLWAFEKLHSMDMDSLMQMKPQIQPKMCWLYQSKQTSNIYEKKQPLFQKYLYMQILLQLINTPKNPIPFSFSF